MAQEVSIPFIPRLRREWAQVNQAEVIRVKHLEERAEHQGWAYRLITWHELIGTRLKLRVRYSGKVGEGKDGSQERAQLGYFIISKTMDLKWLNELTTGDKNEPYSKNILNFSQTCFMKSGFADQIYLGVGTYFARGCSF